MVKQFTPKVVTGNALMNGDVIYLKSDNSWTRDLRFAEVITDISEADVRLVQAAERADEVVGAYLADVEIGENGPSPVHFREEFRAQGPSNYFHGHQEKAREDV